MSENLSDHRNMHDPDMKWNAFGGKSNGASSQNVQGYGNGARTGRSEHDPMNIMPINGGSLEINDRRQKYLKGDAKDLNVELLKPNRRAG